VEIEKTQISHQKELLFNEIPSLDIKEACKVGKGILQFSILQKANYIQHYLQANLKSTFFIPASGSGSRMFDFLYGFLENPNDDNQSKVERFINHFEEFAFAKKIPSDLILKLKEGEISLEEFIRYLLDEKGLNYNSLPKGLIPFHRIGPFVLTPFQSHIIQGVEVIPNFPRFHFTINNKFKELISKEQESIKNIITEQISVDFSIQNPDSDSYVFNEEKEVVYDENKEPLRRPAGHGALISNLSEIKTDIIFVKNIDNLQHYNKAQDTFESFQFLGGLVMEIETERNKLLNHFTKELFYKFNTKYEIIPYAEVESLSVDKIQEILNLPIRVCGMVKNEGEPGGGPFWLHKDGVTRKQILEKTQLNTRNRQYNLLVNSTHFNPVFMALRNVDSNGNPFDLSQLIDNDQYLCVKKNQKGKAIRYVEQPGLWNGSMYNWLTVFVEIPAETFSPVKSVLDLLSPLHREK
jgi:hypothetical protein